MTFPDAELNALYSAICQNPHEDTPRLVFADRCAELDDPEVNAYGEYVRTQIELHDLLDGFPYENVGCIDMYCDPDDPESQAWKHGVLRLQAACYRLVGESGSLFLTLCPCRICAGEGYLLYDRPPPRPRERGHCTVCGGTGQLLNAADGPKILEFRRGFVATVGCRADHLWRPRLCGVCRGDGSVCTFRGPGTTNPRRSDCRLCGGAGRLFRPTPWVREVVRATPVTCLRNTGSGYSRYDPGTGRYVVARGDVPHPVWVSVDVRHDTDAAKLDARVGEAVADWARAFADHQED